MLLSRGDPYVFIDYQNRPISTVLLAISAVALLSMMLPGIRKGKDKAMAG
jgi:TctA family transporter